MQARLLLPLALSLAVLRAQDPAGHWAYQPVVQPQLPAVEQQDWCQQPLDRFVLARLEREGLQPAAAASRARWLRRVALDLVGLPPTPEQVRAFVADRSEGAYARQVDRLLEDPAFGERWALVWLDMARYADSRGYEADALRHNIWRWRDWVIDAIQRDMPFDQFTIEQLAGDLLPDPTLEQQVATAFHRNTMTNTEGGTDDEEFRSAAVVDRVNTTMSVWMGSTVACAQCHDHKYDPISHREYFELFDFFNQTEDRDRGDEAPTLRAPTATQLVRAQELEDELQQALALGSEQQAVFEDWTAAQRARLTAFAGANVQSSDWHELGPVSAASFDAAYRAEFAPVASVQLDEEQEGLRWQARPDLQDGKVHTWQGAANATYFLYRTLTVAEATDVVLRLGSDDAIAVYLNGEKLMAHKVSRAAGADQELVDVQLRAGTNELLLAVTNGGGLCGFYFRLTATSFDAPTNALLSRDLAGVDAGQHETLTAAFLSTAPELAQTRGRIERARAEIDRLQGPAVPVMRELPSEQRRATHVHLRGSFLSKGDEVAAAVPAVFPAMPDDAPRNRLGLARWLVSRENPLTARVQVNRFWEQLFGRGLVATGEDFGTQGDRPSHPLLLDWLASEFMEDGWSVKRLLKRIVLSSTYRQSVVPADGMRERDPHNLLLTRGPSFRLPAEVLRDRALAVSGLLQHQVGGPSVMPDQPDGVWAQIYSGAKWRVSPGADRYRRSLYTFWRRTSPHPAMTTFDAPSREFCVVSRVRTNTPLQALVTWNEPQFVGAARELAARVLREGGDDDERLDRMFWLALLREPDAGERERMLAFVRGELRQFAADSEAARSLVPDTDSDAARHAAWTMCASVLMNLDEFLTKG